MNALVAFIVVLEILLACVVVQSMKLDNAGNATMYLMKYGYLSTPDPASAEEGIFKDGLSRFQKMMGLEQTGKINDKTLEMMNMPRCGLPDVYPKNYKVGKLVGKLNQQFSQFRKRYSLQGSKIQNDRIIYRVNSFPSNLRQRGVLNVLRKAFQLWSQHVPLDFIEDQTPKFRVDIDIEFVGYEHDDGHPFDGKGGELAHAFYPAYGSDIHFDTTEKFSLDGSYGTNLLYVATHEIGHALGLLHSEVRESVMWAFVPDVVTEFALHSDDIKAVIAIYGRRLIKLPPTSPPKPNGAPDICSSNMHIDAISRMPFGKLRAKHRTAKTIIFKDDYYWLRSQDDTGRDHTRLVGRISQKWPGIKGPIDAALFVEQQGCSYMFKGNRVWKIDASGIIPGYPRAISRVVPKAFIKNNLDAAFVWRNKVYFTKGAFYDRPTKAGYRLHLSNWRGLPDRINAAFQDSNGHTYFFAGKNYYKFDDRNFRVYPEYPRSTKDWLGCDLERSLP